MHNLALQSKIESILFFKGEPVTLAFLTHALAIDVGTIQQALHELEQTLKDSGRGIVVLQNGDQVSLGTSPFMGKTIEALIKEELVKDLGKAGLETLAIVLYRGPVARSEINYIRGVNSNYILRSLMVRGLIEKDDRSTARSIVYRPTFELLSYLGITRVEDLPEYEGLRGAVENFEESQKQADEAESSSE